MGVSVADLPGAMMCASPEMSVTGDTMTIGQPDRGVFDGAGGNTSNESHIADQLKHSAK